MPEHLKSTPNSKEFNKYLKGFMKRKERDHRIKVIKEAANTISLMITS